MRKRGIAVVLIMGMISGACISVAADTKSQLEKKLQEQKKGLQGSKSKLNENQKKIKEVEKELEEIEIKIEQLDCNIIDIHGKLEKTDDKVSSLSEKIIKTEEEIVIMENNINEETEAFGKRVRAIYMGGNNNMLEMLLDSKSLNDFLTRTEVMKKISEYDEELLSNMKESKIELGNKKEKLDVAKEEMIELREKQQIQLSKLEASKETQMNLIKDVTERKAYLIASVPEYEVAIKEQELIINRTVNKIASLATGSFNSTGNSYSRGNGSFNGNDVIGYAKKFIGVPYKWAGDNPSEGMDCSGYVKYVYSYFGVHLTRSTYTQVDEGAYISREELQPGDLVFFGYGSPHHVGIYVGDNYYIHAPRTGDYIKISLMNRKDYMTGRRII